MTSVTQGKLNESKFSIEILESHDELIDLETKRVMYYIEKFDEYRQKGYRDIILFPEGIDPTNSSEIEVAEVRNIIKIELDKKARLYHNFTASLKEMSKKLQICIPSAKELYGFDIIGNYRIAPTSYGTVGSASDLIFLRLPELRPANLGNAFTTGKYRSLIEILIHEILAHKVTKYVRESTALEEPISATHQWHKEYLMDLLGRTILIESDLMKAGDVAMQVVAMRVAQKDIDPLYYDTGGNLPWRGDLQSLVKRIDMKLNEEG